VTVRNKRELGGILRIDNGTFEPRGVHRVYFSQFYRGALPTCNVSPRVGH
jgi:hypothetical protein